MCAEWTRELCALPYFMFCLFPSLQALCAEWTRELKAFPDLIFFLSPFLQATCAEWDRELKAFQILEQLQLPQGVAKPRVLVCAPSNAATDELCERILKVLLLV